MKAAVETSCEQDRLDVLESLSAVYSPAEKRFDEITRMARTVFDVPVALVSLVAKDRQWFKSTQGLDAAETPRKVSFCGHAIQQADAFIVEDASQHPWFADNPLVTDEPNIRFYAGQPLEVKGQRIGTLCLLDSKPRQLTPEQIRKLKVFAEFVEEEITLAVLSKGQQELLKKLTEAQRSALIDPPTQMWNRSGIEQVMLHEFKLAGIENRALVLAMFELDGPETIAHSHGEQVASRVTAKMARRLRETADASDALGRYDANTLFVLYAFKDLEHSQQKAKKLLTSLTGEIVEVGDTSFTVSARAASMIAYSPSKLSVANLIIQTDKALAQVRQEPAGSIHFFDRRQEARE